MFSFHGAKVGRRRREDGSVDGGLAKLAGRKRVAGGAWTASNSWLPRVGGDRADGQGARLTEPSGAALSPGQVLRI